MHDRRLENRLLCADLVDVQWKEKGGRTRRAVANLEDISLSGACIQLEIPVPQRTLLRISHPKGDLQGEVCYCVYRDFGYFIGLAFDEGCRWSQRQFRPQHLVDPRKLVRRSVGRISDAQGSAI